MNMSFDKKIVLITGASKGIGAQLADDFGRLKAKLILTAAHPDGLKKIKELVHKRKYKADCYHLDFTDAASIRNFLVHLGKYKQIDVCVNNAGINEVDFIEQVREEAWDNIMNVNLKGPFLIIRAIAPKMKKNGYGRIVNISSIFGLVTREKRSIYSASKSGLLGLTRTTAIELARFNVLVNAVSPGFVLTDLTRRMLSKSEMQKLTENIPLGRMAAPQDISSTILFLSSGLNSYIVGQNFIVDGGYVTV